MIYFRSLPRSTIHGATRTAMKSLTLSCVFAILAVVHLPCAIQASSFTIDYEKDTFLKDGEAFRWAHGHVGLVLGKNVEPRKFISPCYGDE